VIVINHASLYNHIGLSPGNLIRLKWSINKQRFRCPDPCLFFCTIVLLIHYMAGLCGRKRARACRYGFFRDHDCRPPFGIRHSEVGGRNSVVGCRKSQRVSSSTCRKRTQRLVGWLVYNRHVALFPNVGRWMGGPGIEYRIINDAS
jgi:hypothetical protein